MRSSAAAVAVPPPLDGNAPVLECMSAEDALAFARRNARLAAALGQTVEEFAASARESVSLEEAVRRGWITAGEQREYEGRATREDLEEAGYSPEEILEILEEQRAR